MTLSTLLWPGSGNWGSFGEGDGVRGRLR